MLKRFDTAPLINRIGRGWQFPLGLLVIVLFLGCGEPPQIISYTVPVKQTRILGAMVPKGKETLFFKIMGSDELVKPLEKPFEEFLKTVKIPESGQTDWTLPENWTEKRYDKSELLAMIKIPVEDTQLNLSVTQLKTMPGVSYEAYTLQNLNRWRDQLTLPTISAEALPKQLTEIELPGHKAKALVVNLVGRRSTSPRQSPAPMAANYPNWDIPEGYVQTRAPNPQFGGRGAYAFKKDGQQVELIISSIGQPITAGNLSEHLDRWRNMVGIPPLKPGEPLDQMKAIKVGDRDGRQLKFVGPSQKTMFVAFTEYGGQTWYFRFIGDTPLVDKEETRFTSIVQSVRFSATKEAGDE